MKGIRIAFVAGAIVALAMTAEAAEVRLRCDYKAPNKQERGERTRIRVDGKDVAEGTYTVTVTSGEATFTATAATHADDDEFEFKALFSSNRGHIRQGATEIPANLGAAGSVNVSVSDLVESVTLVCPGRTRLTID